MNKVKYKVLFKKLKYRGSRLVKIIDKSYSFFMPFIKPKSVKVEIIVRTRLEHNGVIYERFIANRGYYFVFYDIKHKEVYIWENKLVIGGDI